MSPTDGSDRVPNVRPIPPSSPRRAALRPSSSSGAAGKWLGILFLVVLVAAVVAVFVVLPGWVETRRASGPAMALEEVPGTSVEEVEEVPGTSAEPADEPAATSSSSTSATSPTSPEVPGTSRAAVETPPSPSPDPAEERFVAAMSEGLEALAGEDFTTARNAFERALDLRPRAGAARDGLARAAAGERALSLTGLRTAAEKAEAEERWAKAARLYDQALEIDPDVAFAQVGGPRADDRADLDNRLVFHLENTDRLASAAVLQEADALLRRARRAEPMGLRLARQIAKLEVAVARYGEPVEVTLLSDAETVVTVYRVGSLGAFERHRLELRPGAYTVIGRRPGFRDVHRELVVAPGETPPPIEIRCEEKL